MTRIVSLTLFLVLGAASADDVYKCTDAAGNISYQAQPCAGGQISDMVTVDNKPDPDYVAPDFTSSPDEQVNEVDRARKVRDKTLAESQAVLCENAKKTLETYIALRDLGSQSGTSNRYMGQTNEMMISNARGQVARYCR